MSTESTPRGPSENSRTSVIRKMRDALQSLRGSIKSENGPDEPETMSSDESLEQLVTVIIKNKEELLNSGLNDPQTLKLIESIEGKDVAGVIELLRDEQEVGEDLDVFTDEIAEMNSALERPEKLPLHEKISNRVETYLSEKFPKEKIKEMASTYGIDLEDGDVGKIFRKLVNIVKMGFASMIEKIPTMQNTSRNLRWTIALEEAQGGDSLTSAQKEKLKNPEEQNNIHSKWNQAYMKWLARKKAAPVGFAEPVPTIADILNETTATEVASSDAENLFGIDGLKQGKEKSIDCPTTLKLNGKELTLHRDKIIFNGTERKFEQGNVRGVFITPTSVKVADTKIRITIGDNSVETNVLDVAKKFNDTATIKEIVLNETPKLTLLPA